jgi:hypothetical protein
MEELRTLTDEEVRVRAAIVEFREIHKKIEAHQQTIREAGEEVTKLQTRLITLLLETVPELLSKD